MRYLGSKNRISKYLLPIILENRVEGQYYVEPFVGGANLIDKVKGNRIGSDCNKYLIAYLKEAQKGWIPPNEVSEVEYIHMKNHIYEYPDYLIGYVGFGLSFGAKFFCGYCKDRENKRDHAAEIFRNHIKQLPNLMGIDFIHCNYDELVIPPKSIIYCDPPYINTTSYKGAPILNYEKYYSWLRNLKELGHSIFCSEYFMPSDFKVVFETPSRVLFSKDKRDQARTEKLFTL